MRHWIVSVGLVLLTIPFFPTVLAAKEYCPVTEEDIKNQLSHIESLKKGIAYNEQAKTIKGADVSEFNQLIQNEKQLLVEAEKKLSEMKSLQQDCGKEVTSAIDTKEQNLNEQATEDLRQIVTNYFKSWSSDNPLDNFSHQVSVVENIIAYGKFDGWRFANTLFPNLVYMHYAQNSIKEHMLIGEWDSNPAAENEMATGIAIYINPLNAFSGNFFWGLNTIQGTARIWNGINQAYPGSNSYISSQTISKPKAVLGRKINQEGKVQFSINAKDLSAGDFCYYDGSSWVIKKVKPSSVVLINQYQEIEIEF